RVLIDRDVDVAPPDVVLGVGMLDDPLVLGAAARLGTRIGDQGAGVGDVALVVFANRFGIQRRGTEVATDVLHRDANAGQVDGRLRRVQRQGGGGSRDGFRFNH